MCAGAGLSDPADTMAGMSPDVLAGLDPEQRLVAEALGGPVVVHAGAGTGKTRAITHRIAHAVLTGRHSAGTGLAVTFTNRAAGEMRGRLAQLGVPMVTVRTFHAAALSQLRYFWPHTVGGPFPDLVASKAGLVGRACRELGIPSAKPLVRDLAAEIEWAGSSLVSAGDYARAARAAGRGLVGTGADTVDHAGVARVIAAYQEVKSRANAIDFEDVLLSMIALIGDRPDVADEIRRHYRWFTVDEYQDITPAQERLLAGWIGDRDDVCVVGDANQTIYSFAGADPAALDRFARTWPDATQIVLDRCYRCTPQIVAAANSVIRAGARAGAPQVGDAAAAGREPVLLRSQRAAGPAPEVVTCADDADEAATVAARIREMLAAGVAARDIAILMRTNAASEPVEVALAEAKVPYVMRGAERFFERSEVREAVTRLRGAAITGTRQGAGADPAAGADGLFEQSAEGGVPALVAETTAVLAGMGWAPGGPSGAGASRERWESLAAVVALAGEVAAAGTTTLGGLVEELERRAGMAHAPTADGVTVATLHAAKGLEWPAVFVIGCAEGSLPIVYADTDERIAEERRLFYVGMTRAADRLVVSWALTRTGAGRHREPSRFLAEMRVRGAPTSSTTQAGVVRAGRSRGAKQRSRRPPGRCRVCGAGLVTAPERTLGRCTTCPGNADEALVDRLRAWRLATAKERGVPAYVVFTDITLTALAERRPGDPGELLDIPGIGPAKNDLYGEQLLDLIAQSGAEGSGGDAGVSVPAGGGDGGGVAEGADSASAGSSGASPGATPAASPEAGSTDEGPIVDVTG